MCGKTEVQAALTTMHEYRLLREGWERKQQTAWEVARWEQWMQIRLSPNIKEYNKPSSPQKILHFPWDDITKGASVEDTHVSAEETQAFNAVIADFLQRTGQAIN